MFLHKGESSFVFGGQEDVSVFKHVTMNAHISQGRFRLLGTKNDIGKREIELKKRFSVDEALELEVKPGCSVAPSLSRNEDAEEFLVEIEQDEVALFELDDGSDLILSPGTLEELYAAQKKTARSVSGDDDLIEISAYLPGGQQRGLVGKLIKSVDVLRVKIKDAFLGNVSEELGERAIHALARKIETNIIAEGGLYRLHDIRREVARGDGAELDKLNRIGADDLDAGKPILLFIHGTFSSTLGGFGPVMEANQDGLWELLEGRYGANIIGFEHRTLTESPIRNACDLLRDLPENAELHLVSHSRGGLVGELLCCEGDAFTDDAFSLFQGKRPDGTLVKNAFEALVSRGMSANIYDEHSKDLQELKKLLKKKAPRIQKFVRVGCPARGTTLASGRLDIVLNVLLRGIGAGFGIALSPLYSSLQTFLLAAARERTNPEELPGLEAQMPSSPQIALLNRVVPGTSAPLSVIAADFEPGGIKGALDQIVDLFYWGANDLVVNTASMDGGVPRSGGAISLQLEGKAVMHTNYFDDSRVRRALEALLVKNEALPEGFRRIQSAPKPVPRAGVRSGSGQNQHLGTVIIVPGITGSHLQLNGDRVWVDKSDLVRGAFRHMDVDLNYPFQPDGLVKSAYKDFAHYISLRHHVVDFSYDWRHSILKAADHLATEVEGQLERSKKPIRILAHSMGGLVTRAMMARHPELWKKVMKRKGSRFIMAGTPNKGSHSILRLLAGQDKLINLLSLIDVFMSEREYLNILARFPGVLELLPLSHNERAFKPEIWENYSEIMGSGWHAPTSQALESARETWRIIERSDLNPNNTLYIAGYAKETPRDVRFKKGFFSKKIVFEASREGDGQVLWADGIPPRVPCWYSPALHGDLLAHYDSFPAILELIETGTTALLPTHTHSFASRTAADVSSSSSVMLPERLGFSPATEDIGRLAMGGSVDSGRIVSSSPKTVISVSVTHGNLVFAQKPILVGHFRADGIERSEAALDSALDGRLSERHRLGLYPEELKTSSFIKPGRKDNLFSGVLVVGLGEVGALSPGTLTDTLEAAMLRYCLESQEEQLSEGAGGLELCSLIVGSGSGGVSLSDSVTALLQAAVRANAILLRESNTTARPIISINLIEMYEDRALEALHQFTILEELTTFAGQIAVQKNLRPGDGGLRRIEGGNDGSRMQRLRVTVDDGNMSFLSLSRRAGAPVVTTKEERFAIEPFLREVTHDTSSRPDTGRVLFELLLPRELKEAARDERPLQLILDEEAAEYPWEILSYDAGEGDGRLALRSEMIRQLSTPSVVRSKLCMNRRALVIADPRSCFATLPGAQAEGRFVADLLQKDFETELSVCPRSDESLRLLMTRKCQFLHLSGHGVYKYFDENREEDVSGMVLGDGLYLTASLIQKMTSTPEFVFLNCCHLGNMAGEADDTRSVSGQGGHFPSRPHALAANLAAQFILQGARAVIATGWAVDDAAALSFAECFYIRMEAGDTFSKAVIEARRHTEKLHPGCNTWAAYQCYGEHSYTFASGKKVQEIEEKRRITSLGEAITAVENIEAQSKALKGRSEQSLVKQLETLEKHRLRPWFDDGRLAMARGSAWTQLGHLERAILAYEQARSSKDGRVSVWAMEEQLKAEVRQVLQKLKSQDNSTLSNDEVKVLREPFLSGAEELESFSKRFGMTMRRSAFLGSFAKRRAHMEALCGNKKWREASLLKMQMHYKDAWERALEEDAFAAYPLNNYLLAEFLITVSQGKDISPEAKTVLSSALNDPESLLNQSNELFWHRNALPRIRLIFALLKGKLSEVSAEVVDEYKKIKKLAGSPRQYDLIREDLELIRDIAADRGNTVLRDEMASFIDRADL